MIQPLSVDYRDSRALRNALADASKHLGPIELAICWIHSTAPAALGVVIDALGSDSGARLIHVRASATVDPRQMEPPDTTLQRLGLKYESVLLGFMTEGKRTRWLTDQEITSGVIAAIKHPSEETVVGLISPWSMRP